MTQKLYKNLNTLILACIICSIIIVLIAHYFKITMGTLIFLTFLFTGILIIFFNDIGEKFDTKTN